MDKKIPGRNPPEPVERRPDPTPAPPLPMIGGQGMPTPPGYQPGTKSWEDGGTARVAYEYLHQLLRLPLDLKIVSVYDDQPDIPPGTVMFRLVSGSWPPGFTGHGIGSCLARDPSVVEQILSKLEHIPCMSDDCNGPEDDGRVTKRNPPATRCHRCAAVRLGKKVLRMNDG